MLQPDPPLVSIIIPVRNEERILGRCLESLAGLEYAKDRVEVIVADSLSTDGSRRIAEEYGAKVVPNPGQTVVSGRNAGVAAARGEFIAFTDADCVVRQDWLKAALHAFSSSEIAGAGGVTLFPAEATAFQKAVNMLFLMAGFTGSTAHRQSARCTHEASDLPGCNCMYRRSALDLVMPLDEGLLTAEDVWLNWLLRQRGYRLVVCRDMVLWHHRRTRPASFFRQMYRFGIGRLQAGKRARQLLKPVHVLVGLGLPLGAGALALAIWRGGMGAAAFAGACGALCCVLGAARANSVRAGLWLPFVLAVFATAWSIGFLRELCFPLKELGGR